MVLTLQIRDARKVHVQHCDHRRCLWKFEGEFTPDVDTHDVSISSSAIRRRATSRYECPPGSVSVSSGSRMTTMRPGLLISKLDSQSRTLAACPNTRSNRLSFLSSS